MDGVQKFRRWKWTPFMGEAVPAVFVLHEDYAKLQSELDEERKKTSTSMGVGCGFVYGDYESIKAAQAIVIRLETATARIAELGADYETMRGACGAAQNRILEVARERDAAKAQLAACTSRHYTQLAEEAGKATKLCTICCFGDRPPLCVSPKKRTYVKTTSGDSCTGFVERPQTQGL